MKQGGGLAKLVRKPGISTVAVGKSIKLGVEIAKREGHELI